MVKKTPILEPKKKANKSRAIKAFKPFNPS